MGTEAPDTSFVMALWVAILVCGIGAFLLRRMLFTPLRLKDIAAIRGESGLLASLQNASIIIAALGGAVGVMGFLIWFSTGNKTYMLRAALVAVAILVYAFPRRAAWQRALEAARQKETFDSTAQNEPAVKGFDV